jgi:UDP-glucose 4-epimerase
MSRKVLVTGSDGFIGINLCNYLENNGFDVTKWDIKSGNDFTKKNIPENIEKVFHLACIPQMAASRQVMLNWQINAFGSRRIAEQCKELDIPLVYTSTLSVYGSTLGDWQGNPVFAPKSEYAMAKLAGEFFIKAAHPLKSHIVRLSNVYGPHQTLKSNPDCGVIGRFFHQALRGEPMTVIGTGQQTRDFTYVDDVCDYLFHVRDKVTKNLTSGRSHTVLNIANRIGMLVCGTQTPSGTVGEYSIKSIPHRPIDNITARKGQSQSAHTDIAVGLQKTYEWFTSNME